MTRELQKRLKAHKQNLAAYTKQLHRQYGFKTISGFVYRACGEMIVWVDYRIAIDRDEPEFLMQFRCKSAALDKIMWDVFEMGEEIRKKPFSIHVNGAFTTDYLRYSEHRMTLSPDGVTQEYMENAFRIADEMTDRIFTEIPDIDALETKLLEEEQRIGRPIHLLERALCRLYFDDKDGAYALIKPSLERGDSGGFVASGPEGNKGIFEFMAEYCRK